MANYKILISATAEKSLKKLPKSDLKKIVTVIQGLAINPTPTGCRKLTGQHNIFRVRQGVYRIIYELRKNELTILVLKIGHRKDVYR